MRTIIGRGALNIVRNPHLGKKRFEVKFIAIFRPGLYAHSRHNTCSTESKTMGISGKNFYVSWSGLGQPILCWEGLG